MSSCGYTCNSYFHNYIRGTRHLPPFHYLSGREKLVGAAVLLWLLDAGFARTIKVHKACLTGVHPVWSKGLWGAEEKVNSGG